jgi:hypothetical protein
MTNLKLIPSVILLVFSLTFTFADVIPGRWDKVANLVPGTRIVVEMQSGDSIRGAFVFTTGDSLGIDLETSNRMTVPKNAVLRVLEEKKGKKQTLLGTAIGAGGGVATGLAISSQFDETFFARRDLMALSCGAIGALTGALIGRSIGGDDRQEVIFRSR